MNILILYCLIKFTEEEYVIEFSTLIYYLFCYGNGNKFYMLFITISSVSIIFLRKKSYHQGVDFISLKLTEYWCTF